MSSVAALYNRSSRLVIFYKENPVPKWERDYKRVDMAAGFEIHVRARVCACVRTCVRAKYMSCI